MVVHSSSREKGCKREEILLGERVGRETEERKEEHASEEKWGRGINPRVIMISLHVVSMSLDGSEVSAIWSTEHRCHGLIWVGAESREEIRGASLSLLKPAHKESEALLMS
jgi:hypothetical protein